jgi:hypothetical protein
MLSLVNIIMEKYKILLVKMALNNLTNYQAMLNYAHLCDLHILLGFAYILPLLESTHAFIKFAQFKDVFV